MTPLLLILLAVQGAWAASSVLVKQYDIDQFPKPLETSDRVVSPYIVESAWELIDEADANINILNIEQILKDLARSKDSRANALALCQTVSVVGEMASRRVGDACDFAAYINSPAAIDRWLGRLYYDIDAIVALAENRRSLEENGPRSNCPGRGLTYNFEAAWNSILAEVNPIEVDLVNEEYCTAKRLYRAWNVRSNLIGAAVTACASPKAIAIFQRATPPVANFLRTVADCGNIAGAAEEAKIAIIVAAN